MDVGSASNRVDNGLIQTSGISTSLAIVILASSIGHWIDRTSSRLRTLLTTISINRIAVVVACICWAMIIHDEVPESRNFKVSESRPMKSYKATDIIFLLILALGVMERLSRLANLLSIERDWVPTLAGTTPGYDLTQLNAIMVRIDLICKLGSPIVISALMSVLPPRLGPLLLVICNLVFWPLEYWTARRVWNDSLDLRTPREVIEMQDSIKAQRSFAATFHVLISWPIAYWQSLQSYFAAKVWMPSLAMTSLHSSVLNFSGSMTVFLVQSGFSLGLITGAEVLSAVCEFSSTFVFPWGVAFFSQKDYSPLQEVEIDVSIVTHGSGALESEDCSVNTSDKGQGNGLARLGFYSLCLVLFCAVSRHSHRAPCNPSDSLQIPAVLSLFSLSTSKTSTSSPISAYTTHPLPTIVIILFISLSRLGRWTNVLCSQQLTQTQIAPEQRTRFAGTEAGFASLFGLGHWILTAIWSQRAEFPGVAMGSTGVIGLAVGLWLIWWFRERW